MSVRVAATDDGARLVVEDDGRGFDPTAAGGVGHFGLRVLEDLAHDAGGVLEIDSAPGEGARITVEAPT